MYFANFPQTLYQISGPSYQTQAKFVLLTDITRNVRFKREVLDNIVSYDNYIIPDSDTIEIVSERLYGSPYYHWVLMLLNDRYDYRQDLPMTHDAFEKFIQQKYGTVENAKQLLIDIRDSSNNTSQSVVIGVAQSVYTYNTAINEHVINFLHTTNGSILPNNSIDLSGYNPVYAYDRETMINENKRKIKIVSRNVLELVLSNFNELL